MIWGTRLATTLEWSGEIINLEEKQAVAQRIAARLKEGDVVGFGSGSTSFLAIQAIAERMRVEGLACRAIPTSAEVAIACAVLRVPVSSLLHERPDWAFDGADEVAPDSSLIKGRGGALLREKLVMASSPITYVLVDRSKLVSRLCENFPVPIEVHPLAVHLVEEAVTALGATEVVLRLGKRKDGPVVTENANFLLDARFECIEPSLEQRLKTIPGVIETGLFVGYRVAIVVPGETELASDARP